MEDHVKIIEINATEEDRILNVKCEYGYTSNLALNVCGEENKFWHEYTCGSDEFREKYKNGCKIKINYI